MHRFNREENRGPEKLRGCGARSASQESNTVKIKFLAAPGFPVHLLANQVNLPLRKKEIGSNNLLILVFPIKVKKHLTTGHSTGPSSKRDYPKIRHYISFKKKKERKKERKESKKKKSRAKEKKNPPRIQNPGAAEVDNPNFILC